MCTTIAINMTARSLLVPLCIISICAMMLLLGKLNFSAWRYNETHADVHHEYQNNVGRLEPEGNNVHYMIISYRVQYVSGFSQSQLSLSP